MVSKLELVAVFAFVAIMAAGVRSAVPEADGAAEPANKDADHDDAHPFNKEEIKKFLLTLEKVDIDIILNNTRLMNNNVKCFLNEGPCTAQLREMKKMVPMLIKDSCSVCTKMQKNTMKKAMDAIKARRPNEYEKLSKFFDPEGKFEKKFLDNLNESE